MRTPKESERLRSEILEFCKKPRTLHEAKERFLLSGISAGNFLSSLRWRRLLEHDLAADTYKRSRRKYPWRG